MMDPIRALATVALLLYTDFGDYLESKSLSCPRFRAALDNMIHVHIGILSWSIINQIPFQLNTDLLAVSLGASFIDLDHFIAAGSFSIDKAMHAPHRGPFHSTGLFFLVYFLLQRVKPHAALLFLVAFLPHHIRDSQRRGIYLFPPVSWGLETPPVPKMVVRLFLPLFPWVVCMSGWGKRIDNVLLEKVWVA